MSWPAAIGAVLAALLSIGAAADVARSQTVLSDYESNARATQAHDAAIWRLAFRPTLQVLDQTAATLRTGSPATPEARAEADALIASAKGQPDTVARERLSHAVALLLGRAWTPGAAAVASLSLRAEHPIATGNRVPVTVAATFPAPAATATRFSVELVRAEQTSSATPRRGEMVRRVGEGVLANAQGGSLTVDLGGVEDGFYLLVARLSSPTGETGEAAAPFYVVHDLDARAAAMRARLAPITGHDAARQTAEYPFALAKAILAGQREVISYDFRAAMARSEAITAALKRGVDPVGRAKGLQNRAYRFAETGELIPYQLYVPSTWVPGSKLPLVVALHGANLDETNMLGRAGGRMQKLAEQHGMIVVAPLGYRINSGYGSRRGMTALGAEGERLRRSGEDVLAVADLVSAEYGTDPRRTYLTGNSMGGAGTWWIGGHVPDRWAAIAPAAFGGVTEEDVRGLSTLPILAIVGDHDELGMLERVCAAVSVLERSGVRPQLVVVPGGTHAGAFDQEMPRVFDFFASHAR